MTKEEFIEKLKQNNRAPFLFLGSGFSRHYLNSPDWATLLSKFAPKHINQYYSILGTQYLPTIATAIAQDITENFWKLSEEDPFKKSHLEEVRDNSIVLKLRIADFLNNILKEANLSKYEKELQILQKLNIDGIITTNWDGFVEQLFPKYTTYIGQDELIRSSNYNIGEIYKIHGSCSVPSSMVLTAEDYANFNEKNAYLAAKLITIFVEHPIIFMGYSLSDENIKEILKSIIKCFDKDNREKLQGNLIFVEWEEHDTPLKISEHTINIDTAIDIPVTRLQVHNYIDAFECFQFYQRGIPADLLRVYKKQFYDIVVSEKPQQRLYVLPGSDVDKDKQIQVVYGFGVINTYLSEIGYKGLTRNDLYIDVLDDTQNYLPQKIMTQCIPQLKTSRVFVPVFKYLSGMGIHNSTDYETSEYKIKTKLYTCAEDFQSYNFNENEKRKTLKEVINTYNQNANRFKAVALIPYLSISQADLPILATYIKSNFAEFMEDQRYGTYMRKLICFYDWKKYGWS